MKKIRSALTDNSVFRRSYIICVFMCNISATMLLSYIVLIGMLAWGTFLLIYNEVKRRTVLKMRYSLWLVLFLTAMLITSLIHISPNLLNDVYNLVMLLHAGICFFIFYGVHTEKHLNFRRELYSVCRFIVYTTTVLGIIGLACLMAGIRFEISGLRYIIYENRFTGMYCNPNLLGFIAVIAVFCSHMLLKKDFIIISGHQRVSTIWIASCIAVNLISLMLSDSNGALVLLFFYVLFFIVYKMFGSERRFSVWQIVTKSLACILAGVVIVGSVFFIRDIMQTGFVQLMSDRKPVVVIEGDMDIPEEGITFEHENKNIDSGRFKLWEQGAQMFLKNPVMGIGKGNIYDYGKQMFVNGVKFSDKYGALAPLMTDFHNGYLTILVCSGAVGFLLFAIFGLRFFIHITKHVFREDGLNESTLPCMFSFLCAYAVYAFIDEALLFNVSIMVIFSWLIMGYASCFLVRYEPDHPLKHFRIPGGRLRRTVL